MSDRHAANDLEDLAQELVTISPDVAQNPDAACDADTIVSASQAVAVAVAVLLDDNITDDDRSLVMHAKENLGSLSATEAQKLLRRQEMLVSNDLVSSHPGVHVATDGSSGMHFLMHAERNLTTPIYNLNGPQSGQLYPGDEVLYPGSAMLKINASVNRKSERNDAHERLIVQAWREVNLGKKHGAAVHSPGTISERGTIRSPKHGEDFDDILPKVSLVVFTPRPSSPTSHKRQAPTEPSDESTASVSHLRSDMGSVSFRKVVTNTLYVGGLDVVQELAALKEQVMRMPQTQSDHIMPQAQLHAVPVSSSSSSIAAVAEGEATCRTLNVDELHVGGRNISNEIAMIREKVQESATLTSSEHEDSGQDPNALVSSARARPEAQRDTEGGCSDEDEMVLRRRK